jgi:hypothetical protein
MALIEYPLSLRERDGVRGIERIFTSTPHPALLPEGEGTF